MLWSSDLRSQKNNGHLQPWHRRSIQTHAMGCSRVRGDMVASYLPAQLSKGWYQMSLALAPFSCNSLITIKYRILMVRKWCYWTEEGCTQVPVSYYLVVLIPSAQQRMGMEMVDKGEHLGKIIPFVPLERTSQPCRARPVTVQMCRWCSHQGRGDSLRLD